jgi:predicted nucleotidyltransferase
VKDNFASVGFRHPQNLILSFVGGSQLHGAKLEGTDDTDWYGVFIEPPHLALGIDSEEHFVYTTGGERGGNKPTDTDVCLYSLRKWARLAAKGNPSVLHFLFAPATFEHVAWCRFAINPSMFLAKSHLGQFLGYANAQLQRLLNLRGQKDCHRPFLEEQHGYDTKYAMHIIRLLGEAKEYMESGRIMLPRPNADELIAIRNGKYKLFELTEWADTLEREAIAARDKSSLPEKVDRLAISKKLADAYQFFYNWNK